MVKQQIALVNINILGNNELKWAGMGKFNHCIYYCGQEFLRRNGVAIIINKGVQNAVLGCNLKNDKKTSVRFQGKPFNITVIQVYALHCNDEETEAEWFYEDLQYLLELTHKKDVLFHDRQFECKSRKSGDTQRNGQIWSWIDNEAGKRLTQFCQENVLVIANTLFQQHKRQHSTHGNH